MSEKQYRDKIATIKRDQATQETAAGKARAAAAKHRADALKERNKINARTSPSSARTYEQNARRMEQRAESEDTKASRAATKLGELQRSLVSAEEHLARAIKTTRQREESARKTAERASAQAEARRRQEEKRHAREVAQLGRQTVHHVHEYRALPEVKPEPLRVLYLTASPGQDLRVDAEVRSVQQHVRGALHRDLVEIHLRPAATAEDLIDGLNDIRPHVVHFSGHGGGSALFFDNGSVEAPDGKDVSYELLNKALGATGTPPTLVVLNGCDTLDGAEILLESTAVVIATGASITDLAGSLFAARFYAAIASAQPVEAAVAQASVAVDMAGLDEGWKLESIARDGVDTSTMILVQVPAPSAA